MSAFSHPDAATRPARRRKADRRLHRRLARLESALPGRVGRGLNGLRRPGMGMIRIPVALLFILGGLLGFLPILGFWMLPLGLLLLAVDMPVLKGPVGRTMVRVEHWWRSRRRRDRP